MKYIQTDTHTHPATHLHSMYFVVIYESINYCRVIIVNKKYRNLCSNQYNLKLFLIHILWNASWVTQLGLGHFDAFFVEFHAAFGRIINKVICFHHVQFTFPKFLFDYRIGYHICKYLLFTIIFTLLSLFNLCYIFIYLVFLKFFSL